MSTFLEQTCPRCGFIGSEVDQSSKPLGGLAAISPTDNPMVSAVAAHSELTEADVIEEEVLGINSLIDHLIESRARLFRRINQLRAKTRSLPPELLSIIFQMVCSPVDWASRQTGPASWERIPRRSMQFILGSVSHHWRETARSIPQLWTTLELEFHTLTSIENQVSLLQLHLQKAEYMPMDLAMDFRWWEEPSITLIPIRKLMLTDHAQRMENLTFINLPSEWITSIPAAAPNCKNLALSWTNNTVRAQIDGIDLREFHRLGHLRLYGLFSQLKPTHSLTHLTLQVVFGDLCLKLLVECPHLVMMHTSEVDPPLVAIDSDSLVQPTTIPCLEHLTWQIFSGNWGSTFLDHVKFQKLRHLSWSGTYREQSFSEEGHQRFTRFFSHLPSSLHSLELTGNMIGTDLFRTMVEIFSSMPELRELVLTNFPGTSLALIMIARPTAAFVMNYDKREFYLLPRKHKGPTLLPALCSLSLRRHDELNPDQITDFLDAVVRAGTFGDRFSLMMSGEVGWTRSAVEKIQELLGRGARIEIIQQSRPLDFEALVPDSFERRAIRDLEDSDSSSEYVDYSMVY